MAEHPASERGGWGIRLHGGSLPHPSGSCLNCYSLGDVVAYDSEEEAEAAAHDIRTKLRLYERVTVEPVAKGQRQPSIADERHEVERLAAYERGVRDAAERALGPGVPSAERLAAERRILARCSTRKVEAMADRRFPIMGGPSVPWALIEPHERQAIKNHDQTLDTDATRTLREEIAALRARLERAESDRETLTRLVTATEQRRDEYRDMMYAERGRAERYREALENVASYAESGLTYCGFCDHPVDVCDRASTVECDPSYGDKPCPGHKVRKALAATGDEEGKGGEGG